MTETPEWYFFKYAYPCMSILVQIGELTKKELQSFDKQYAKGEAPSKKVLEKANKEAFRRMKELGDPWSWEVLHKYWEGEDHNKFIERRDGNYSKFDDVFCELCKIHKGVVIETKRTTQGVVLTITVNGERRKVMQGKYLDAKKGDTVLTHLAYAVQKG